MTRLLTCSRPAKSLMFLADKRTLRRVVLPQGADVSGPCGIGATSGVGCNVPVQQGRSDWRSGFSISELQKTDHAASRNRRDGFSIVTIVFAGMLRLSVTLEPTCEPAPMTVVPPRIVALL